MYKNRQSTLSLPPLFRLVVIGLLLPMLFLSAPLTAGANGTADAGVDAVFVVDTSNSMNKTDPGKTAAEVMSMFIDMSEATRTRIGFVAYNDRIVQAQSPASIAEARNREQLKRTIQGLRYSGYSDLGLGLRRGAEMIEKAKDPAR
ncbi:VWA domain-containing protein, partial [Brevibacillus sp. BC25]|uniref:vWA domain-containing protein n=1 Tax=Brevibacillus sp. BC25 TaxID=1144308 RepID=UPI000271312F